MARWKRCDYDGYLGLDLGLIELEVMQDEYRQKRWYKWTAADPHSGIFFARKDSMKRYCTEVQTKVAAEKWARKVLEGMLRKLGGK